MTTYYVGNHFEWTGDTTSMIKYYYAGSQRVAMRDNNTLYYLLGDHGFRGRKLEINIAHRQQQRGQGSRVALHAPGWNALHLRDHADALPTKPPWTQSSTAVYQPLKRYPRCRSLNPCHHAAFLP